MENALFHPSSAIYFAVAIAVFAVAFGISKIGKSAMEAIARQPEKAGNIQSAMVIACALIEGAGLIAIIFAAFIK